MGAARRRLSGAGARRGVRENVIDRFHQVIHPLDVRAQGLHALGADMQGKYYLRVMML